jgi:2-keto-4-pentenoate hydratase/2-oxohepta-3-ene-1,7-dioic acid hydratase in catechol pathway
MRLVTYSLGGARRLGAWIAEGIVDLPEAVGHPAFPSTMEALISRNGGTVIDAVYEALDKSDVLDYLVPRAKLLVPLLPSSLRDFLAFEDHVKAGAKRRKTTVPDVWYEMPIYYKGNHRSVIGPGATVEWPSFTKKLDYECEVAAIVGKPGRDLTTEQAEKTIFGYTLMNDWSARDIQAKEMTGWLGPAKGKDFATSLGPCIVTADELDPSHVQLEARVDGEVWSKGALAAMRWSFAEMIAHVSQGEDVYPGDVYGSGTFGGGCGLDQNRFLDPGQVVELEGSGIGVLRNRVGKPKRSR